MSTVKTIDVATPYSLKCAVTGAVNDENKTTTYCLESGYPLTVEYAEKKDHIQYPLKSFHKDPLRTKPTSLVFLKRLSEKYDAEIWAKLEFENPTGCFKDRGSQIEVLKAIELGKEAICLASTGNMAASVAAYACYYKVPCFVFVPEKTTAGKLAQAMMYNAKVIRVKGDYSDCERTCRAFAERKQYYLAGDYVYRCEGQKSFSWELVDQEQGQDFDHILVPVGCGTNFGAIWKGLVECKEAGKIDKLPKMVAVQPDGCSPVIEGIQKGKKIIKEKVYTQAGAVAAADPVDFVKVLQGIRESDGLALTVSEEEMIIALKEMAVTEGYFTEPACALPLAALKKYEASFSAKKVLLVLTGTGLKDAGIVENLAMPMPVLPNDLTFIDQFIDSGYLEVQNTEWGAKRTGLLDKLHLDSHQIAAYHQNVDDIKSRNKTLNETEKEILVSLLFNEKPGVSYPFKIIDYHLNLRKEQQVEAFVEMLINGEDVISKGIGVGPIDAVLEAVKLKTDKIMPVEVTNFNMDVLSEDTEALVVISFTLKTKDGQEWVSRAASPDMIEATLAAFSKGLAQGLNRLNS